MHRTSVVLAAQPDDISYDGLRERITPERHAVVHR
jgi:hypothetical protein